MDVIENFAVQVSAVPDFIPTEPAPAPKPSRWWHVADRVGATASFLCAVHCALLPFVLTLLPLIGLGFLAGHQFERDFVIFAIALALFALVSGYRRHRQRLPLSLAGPGAALLLFGVTVAEAYPIAIHSALVATGGTMVATAHFMNLWYDRRHDHRHAPTRDAHCAG